MLGLNCYLEKERTYADFVAGLTEGDGGCETGEAGSDDDDVETHDG